SSATSRFGGTEPTASPVADDSGGFASGRSRPASLPAAASAAPVPRTLPDGRPQPPATPNPITPLPPGRYVAGSGSGMQPYAPPDAEFPVPYMMGGARPKTSASPGQVPTQATAPPPGTAGVELPPLPSATPAPASPEPTTTATAKPARKPLNIDPALLERALLNRYTTPQ